MAAIRRVAALKALVQALMGARGSGAPGIGDRLRAIPRMLSQGFSGRYPYLKKSRVTLAAVALLYIISPIDFIPEAILPILGLGDDALVAAWLAGAVLSETEAFLAWEKDRSRVVTGEVIA